ncbi:MAG: HAD-IA family hydrolase [Candidatus Coatesbacteria bacterium]
MNLRAAIFDFDGVILETEEGDFEGWRQVYADHGAELRFEDWAVCIGTTGAFHPAENLERLIGRPVDREAARRRHQEIQDANTARLGIKPGVIALLDEADRAGIRLAVASSSGGGWVPNNLAAWGLAARFPVVVTADGLLPPKPDPAVYVAALEALGVAAGSAVAFEDSPNGIAAAKAAGIFAVAVPNALTARLDLSRADLRVGSLAEVTLSGIDRRMSNGRGHA